MDDYEGFKLAVILNFGVDTSITEEEFLKEDVGNLCQKLYYEGIITIARIRLRNPENAVPVFKNILLKNRDAHIENVVVPFSDGKKAIKVMANLQKTLDTNGAELMNALESKSHLPLLMMSWKEHLRAMDDLKQSVQTAYEQKDPLVIYKMEAFGLSNNGRAV